MSQADGSTSTTAPDRGPQQTTSVNLSLPPLSRRGVIAAMAGAAAGNVPMIAASAAALPAASAAAGSHPDQALLDLGRQYQTALDAEDAACEVWEAAWDAVHATEPAMPDVLRHRMDDHSAFQFPALGETRWICDNDLSDFYNSAEVAYIRSMQHRTEDGLARADEIIVAWDRHRDACSALAASLGCHDAEAAYYEAVDARQGIASAIAAARAMTLAGLAVRAGIVAGLIGDDDEDDEGEHLPTDQKMIAAIVRDLIQITT